MLTALLRYGAVDRSRFRDYKEIYNKMKASKELLIRLYIDMGANTSVNYNAVRVKYGEDAWLIEPLNDEGLVRLKHNNYKVNGDLGRTFTGGFHEQNMGNGRHSFKKALNIIEQYDFHKHVSHQAEVLDGNESAVGNENIAERETEIKEKRETLFMRVVKLIKGWFFGDK